MSLSLRENTQNLSYYYANFIFSAKLHKKKAQQAAPFCLKLDGFTFQQVYP